MRAFVNQYEKITLLGFQKKYRIDDVLHSTTLVTSVAAFSSEKSTVLPTLSPLSGSTQLCHWLELRELVTRVVGCSTTIRITIDGPLAAVSIADADR